MCCAMILLLVYLRSALGTLMIRLHHISSGNPFIHHECSSSFIRGHRAWRPGSNSANSGIRSLQAGTTRGQRGAKAQPGGMFDGSGGAPGIGVSGPLCVPECTVDPKRPIVYGCRGESITSEIVPVSTKRPACLAATRAA